MKSLAIKDDYGAVATPGPSREYFPTLTINEKAVPELSDMAVGDEFLMVVKCRITGINADNTKTRYNLDCLKAEWVEEKKDQKDGSEA